MTVFINTPEDMQWLREVHDVEEEYNSAIVYGNEDAPCSIELFHSAEPGYGQLPDCIKVPM